MRIKPHRHATIGSATELQTVAWELENSLVEIMHYGA